jgi:hypothetical protein
LRNECLLILRTQSVVSEIFILNSASIAVYLNKLIKI